MGFFVAQNRSQPQYGASEIGGVSYLSPVGVRVYGATMAQPTTMMMPVRDGVPYDIGGGMKSVLAQHKRAAETITAEHHGDDVGTYNYLVRIDGGKHSNLEIHCHTITSVLWLFDLVCLHRTLELNWNWLAPLEEL